MYGTNPANPQNPNNVKDAFINNNFNTTTTPNVNSGINEDDLPQLFINVILEDDLMSQMSLFLMLRILQAGKIVIKCPTAKSMWTELILGHKGPSETRDTKIQALRLKFNAFKALKGKKVQQTYTKLKILLNNLESKDVIISQSEDSDCDVEENTSSSKEFLDDLNVEFHDKALLAKKRDSTREDEGITKVRAFMATTDDEPAVGKIDARSGQWADITMKKDPMLHLPKLSRAEPIGISKGVVLKTWSSISGKMKHKTMTKVKQYLHRYSKDPGPKVVFGDNSSGDTEGYGSVNCNEITFTRVAYVNGLKYNLISINQLYDANFKVLFTKTQGTIFGQNNDVVLIAPRRKDVYVIDMSSYPEGSNTYFFAKASNSVNWLWHKRPSHLNFKNINKLAKHNLVVGLPSLTFLKDKPCSTHEKGKHYRASFKTKQSFSISKYLYLLHMDLFRPVKPQTINQNIYTLVIVDEYSRQSANFHPKNSYGLTSIEFEEEPILLEDPLLLEDPHLLEDPSHSEDPPRVRSPASDKI
nr:retrovirus-related Pol polyprotein from transposon TNT 1-94 [Tanacetum cinerariifolium]